MLSLLTNIRSTKVLYFEGFHLITAFPTISEFGSQKVLLDRNLAHKCHYWTEIWNRDFTRMED